MNLKPLNFTTMRNNILFLYLLWISTPGLGLPRFAARTGSDCGTCHVSPSGGGMRNAYGRGEFSQEALPANPLKDNHHMGIDATLNPSISMGADLRLAYIELQKNVRDEVPASKPQSNQQSFMLMQGDLYLAAENDFLTLYLDKGVHESYEAFILLHGILPWQGYVRMGYFIPTYGIRTPNHSAFIREKLGFGPLNKDSGIEVGFSPQPFTAQVAVVNGGRPQELEQKPLVDDNKQKGLVGRVEIKGGSAQYHWGLGSSYYSSIFGNFASDQSPTGEDKGGSTRVKNSRWGLFLTSHYQALTYLAEVDKSVSKDKGQEPSKTTSISVTYQEFSWLITKGWELEIIHERLDPDLESSGGIQRRWTAGLEWFPIPNFEVKALMRRTLADADQLEAGMIEHVFMAHMFF